MRKQAWTAAALLAAVVLAGCAAPQAVRQGDEDTNRAPVARFTLSATDLRPGVEVRVDASASHDPDGRIRSYTWNFGDGTVFGGPAFAIASHAYAMPGPYTITLTVSDSEVPPKSTSLAQQVGVAMIGTFAGAAGPTADALGEDVLTASFQVLPGARLLRYDVRDASAAPPGSAADPAAPAPTAVRLQGRLLGPGGAEVATAEGATGNATAADPAAAPVAVLSGGLQPGDLAPGFWTLEVRALDGRAQLQGTVLVSYAP